MRIWIICAALAGLGCPMPQEPAHTTPEVPSVPAQVTKIRDSESGNFVADLMEFEQNGVRTRCVGAWSGLACHELAHD